MDPFDTFSGDRTQDLISAATVFCTVELVAQIALSVSSSATSSTMGVALDFAWGALDYDGDTNEEGVDPALFHNVLADFLFGRQIVRRAQDRRHTERAQNAIETESSEDVQKAMQTHNGV